MLHKLVRHANPPDMCLVIMIRHILGHRASQTAFDYTVLDRDHPLETLANLIKDRP